LFDYPIKLLVPCLKKNTNDTRSVITSGIKQLSLSLPPSVRLLFHFSFVLIHRQFTNTNMPPQSEKNDVGEGDGVSGDNNNSGNDTTAEGSYWDAPPEEKLNGARLSTLDMTLLESNHPDEKEKKTDSYWEAPEEDKLKGKRLSSLDMTLLERNHPDETQEKTDSYWEAPEEDKLKGNRLSSLDMTLLESNHPDKKQERTDSYWEAPEEDELKGKRISTLDMSLLGSPGQSTENAETQSNSTKSVITAEEPDLEPSYWESPKVHSSLRGKTLSTLDMTALESNHPEQKQEKTDSYWEAPEEDKLKGKRLSSLDMTLLESNHPKQKQEKTDSYWEAPEEDKLKGKRLSSLDMTLLESNHPDEKQEKTDSYWEAPEEDKLKGKRLSSLDMTLLDSNHPDEKQEKTDSYWEAPEDDKLKGKRLSTLDMTLLDSNHPDQMKKKHDNYWEALPEEKLEGKRISTIDVRTLEDTGVKVNAVTATVGESTAEGSYWDDAPIEKSLEGKRLSSVELAAMDKQRVDKAPKPAQPYWDWNGPVNKMKSTLSKMSLSNLRKGSKNDDVVLDDDCVHGGTNGVPSRTSTPGKSSSTSLSSSGSGSGSVKPITKKKHKLRDSWRNSLKRFSTNTLDQLDESTGSGMVLGKRIFKSRNSLDVSGSSQLSTGSGSDAIMF